MEILSLKLGIKTPEVFFDAQQGILEIKGKSIPENAYNFYKKLLDWIDGYKKQPAAKTKLIFQLTYFNSSSAEYILDIMKKIEELQNTEKQVEIDWLYDEEDEDMLSIGEDFASLLKIPLKMKAISAESD